MRLISLRHQMAKLDPRPYLTHQTNTSTGKFWNLAIGVYLSVILIAVLGIGLTVLALEMQSAVRAYVIGEGFWSKAQKEAIYRLDRYASTGDPAELSQAREMLEVPLADLRARQAMEQQPPDRETAIREFIDARNHPDDAEKMVWLFLNLREAPYLRESVAYWRKSDAYILQLQAIADEMEAKFKTGRVTDQSMQALRQTLNRLVIEIRPLQDGFSESLGRGARWVDSILKWTAAAAIITLSFIVCMLFRWATRRIRESERKFRDTFEQAGMGMAQMHLDGTLIAVNYSLCRLLGYHVDDLVGQSLVKFLHPEQDLAQLQRLLDGEVAPQTEDYQLLNHDGVPLWCKISISKINTAWNGRRHMILEVMDVTEARNLMNMLHYQARHDALTGVINRYEFEEQLALLLNNAHNFGDTHALGLIDLDQFKVINDTAGHLAGDEVLQETTRLLQGELRRTDILARLGGDEFGVILIDCDETVAGEVTEKLRRVIESYVFNWGDNELHLGASIGWVPINNASIDAKELLKAADTACYMAKDYGRNQVVRYSPESHDLQSRHSEMKALSEIHAALKSNRMVLYAQEIRSLTAGEKPHCEVLVRMQDLQGQAVLPTAFLPAAEHYNIAPDIDRWVIQATLTTLEKYPQQLAQLGLCHINLSGQSIGRDDFLTFLEQALDQSSIDPSKLCFEITETAAISNLIEARQFFHRLGQRGCVFALDDFGSGLSSFGYLTNLPVDMVKIDGTFVRDVLDNQIHRTIIKSISEIGSLMGKNTVAEFVENDAIRDCVAELGIKWVQGYGIHRPCPFDDLLLMLG